MQTYSASASGGSIGSTIAPTKPFPGLAENIHGLASRLSGANDRLASAVNRLIGFPPPESQVAGKDNPSPDGVLLVAQFGAERIRQQLDSLEHLIERIEGAV